ncbi:hypothetical protein NB636_06305 [Oxalobacter aliiformigenes]|uniref:hypothetical protein n=1 Tax=Oxalobacter aliiformigenes TaxID=2946593 RepID=UPI0022AED8D6|nr:hypothetical protein [Oxalobacter aliiformigenes]MCZ4065632.1 hypothetical protein [Oxalobacter aliiformigenes]WAV98354.1 hypothetical protein NB636_06305 [Oxalobacter aliiformigenes]
MNNVIALPVKQHQPAVLTPDCIDRISRLNDVARDLKQRGYTLGQQELFPIRWSSRPAIEIKRDLSVSIMPLVCQSELTWFDENKGYTVYHNVTIWWWNRS